jgi:hypothetical protein
MNDHILSYFLGRDCFISVEDFVVFGRLLHFQVPRSSYGEKPHRAFMLIVACNHGLVILRQWNTIFNNVEGCKGKKHSVGLEKPII